MTIHFLNNAVQEINDPEAQNLRIDFLRKELLEVGEQLPIRIFFPLKHSELINPENTKLAITEEVKEINHLHVFSKPLFAYEISRLFLDIVKNNMELVIVAEPSKEREDLLWSLEVINAHELEDIYVAYMKDGINEKIVNGTKLKSFETMLRKRFRDYLYKLVLFTNPKEKLILHSHLENHEIKVRS